MYIKTMEIKKDHVFTKSEKGEIKIEPITIAHTKIRYKGVQYRLIYVGFSGLKGVIWRKPKSKRLYIAINSNLSDTEKSKELHRLLRDKKAFERTGRRNIVSWLS